MLVADQNIFSGKLIIKYFVLINITMYVFNLTKDELFQWYLVRVFFKGQQQLGFWINIGKR